MEESNPGGVVRGVQTLVVHRLHDEVERLREPEEEDDVDDREGEHVSRDHGEDHGDKGPGQLDRPEKKGCAGRISRHLPCKEEQVEPAARNSKDQERLLNDPIVLGARYVAVLIIIFLGL